MDDKLVEAIEEGRIVKVPENYAKRQGLIILKKSEIPTAGHGVTPSFYSQEQKKEKMKPLAVFMAKKPDWKEKQVISELVDNFHWQIRSERRKKGITRKQLARFANVSDDDLKILETGRLPTYDFVLLNAIQKTLGINLRKDGKDFTLTTKEIMEKADKPVFKTKAQIEKSRAEKSSDFVDSDVEILDGEI